MSRVWADTEKSVDRFDGLRRICIDEISCKRHHEYQTVVVDHDSDGCCGLLPAATVPACGPCSPSGGHRPELPGRKTTHG